MDRAIRNNLMNSMREVEFIASQPSKSWSSNSFSVSETAGRLGHGIRETYNHFQPRSVRDTKQRTFRDHPISCRTDNSIMHKVGALFLRAVLPVTVSLGPSRTTPSHLSLQPRPAMLPKPGRIFTTPQVQRTEQPKSGSSMELLNLEKSRPPTLFFHKR
jgi:hypothetical protein